MPPRSTRSRPQALSPLISSSTTPRTLRTYDVLQDAPPAAPTPTRRDGSPTSNGALTTNFDPQPTSPSLSSHRPIGHFLAAGPDTSGGGGRTPSDTARSGGAKGLGDGPLSSHSKNAPESRGAIQPLSGATTAQEEQDEEGASDGDSEGSRSSGRQVESPVDQPGGASSQGILVPSGESYQQRSRRTRQLPTSYQTAELQKLLAETAFPTTKRRDELATRIGLSSRKIQIWFQNRRQKARRAQEAQPVYPLSPTGDDLSGPPEGYPSSTSYSSWPPPPPLHHHHQTPQPGWSPDAEGSSQYRNIYSPPSSLLGRGLSPPLPGAGPNIMSSLRPLHPAQPSIFVHEDYGRVSGIKLADGEDMRWDVRDPREPWPGGVGGSGGSSRHSTSRRPGSPPGVYAREFEAAPPSMRQMPMHVQSAVMSGHRGEHPASPTHRSSPPPSAYHPYAGGRSSHRQRSRSRSPVHVVSMPPSRAASPTQRRRHSGQERAWEPPSSLSGAIPGERIMRVVPPIMTGVARPSLDDYNLPPLNLPAVIDPESGAGRATSPRSRHRPTSPSSRAAAEDARRMLGLGNGNGAAASLDRNVSDIMSPIHDPPSSLAAQLGTQSPSRATVLPPPFVLEPQPLWDTSSWMPFLNPRRVSWPNSPIRLNERNLPSRYPVPPGPTSAEGSYLQPWAAVSAGGERWGDGAAAIAGPSTGGAGPSSTSYYPTVPRRRSPSPRSRQ
ncbi:hypothetical protein FRB94_007582 [Tulasnella sp. JGI-2019a]|nr:hypothetical protein FRB94_007582 [Tulasnella sp. JGI-2019a]